MADTPILDADLAAADRQAEQLAERARTGNSEIPSVSPERENDLDKNLEEVLAATNADGTGPKEAAAPAPTPEEAKAAEQKLADERAATEKAEREKAAKPADSKPKGALDDLLSEATVKKDGQETAAKPAVDDPEEVKLRSDASPKTRETFEKLKEVYKGKLDAAAGKQTELEARLKEVEAQLATASAVKPEEVEALKKELEEHRKFRVQFDTEHSPEFKQKYDSRIASNYDAIYDRLAHHKLPAEELAALKAMPQDERDTAIEELLKKLESSPASKRFIEAKLGDNLAAQDDRRKELDVSRSKASEILAAKANEPVADRQQRITEMSVILKPALAGLEFMHAKELKATMGAEERKAVEAHNTFAAQLVEGFKRAVLDDSVQSRADAALAIPLAHYFKRELTNTRAQLDAANKELEAIKKAGRTSRTASTSASPNGAAPAPAKTPAKTPSNSGDAVDELFAQVTAAAPGVL